MSQGHPQELDYRFNDMSEGSREGAEREVKYFFIELYSKRSENKVVTADHGSRNPKGANSELLLWDCLLGGNELSGGS
ncbi:hypothetical protein EVAR_38700_1 [Eumeta japonica]|uniref:Uncharacterized protein n=1 Tax=Eumeta variegata TaxID=151549 RepID=A0A4C1XM52_EUMVA|nr:hypothetical protein EVAR_38700_1 [Eumeta japonica]